MKHFDLPLLIFIAIMVLVVIDAYNHYKSVNEKTERVEQLEKKVIELEAKLDYCENPILHNLENQK